MFCFGFVGFSGLGYGFFELRVRASDLGGYRYIYIYVYRYMYIYTYTEFIKSMGM